MPNEPVDRSADDLDALRRRIEASMDEYLRRISSLKRREAEANLSRLQGILLHDFELKLAEYVSPTHTVTEHARLLGGSHNPDVYIQVKQTGLSKIYEDAKSIFRHRESYYEPKLTMSDSDVIEAAELYLSSLNDKIDAFSESLSQRLDATEQLF